MKIAICDDRKEDRDTLRALLEAYGQDFEIREYESGEALRADRAESFFLISIWKAWTGWRLPGRSRQNIRRCILFL